MKGLDFIRRTQISLKKHFFSGKDPITILDFLARFVCETDIQRKSGAQTFNAFPSILTDIAWGQCEAGVKMISTEKNGVFCWSKAAKYLLESHAQSTYVNRAISALRRIMQEQGEKERDYSRSSSDGVSRFESAHSP